MLKKLSEEEYKKGVVSGEFLHVFNTETLKTHVIKRDGYYSPEQLKKFISLESK